MSPQRLIDTLNIKHVSPEIGTASGLKMCFASMTKGLTAIAAQSFTTFRRLGVLPEVQEHLAEYSPFEAFLSSPGRLSYSCLIFRG